MKWGIGLKNHVLSFLKIAAPLPPQSQVINDQLLISDIITCDGNCTGSTSFGSHKVD